MSLRERFKQAKKLAGPVPKLSEFQSQHTERMRDVSSRKKFVRAATAAGIMMTVAAAVFGLLGSIEASLISIIIACLFFWRANVIGSDNV